MKDKAAQYLNEIVSLTVMFSLGLALIASESAAKSADLADAREATRQGDGRIEFAINREFRPLVTALAVQSSGTGDPVEIRKSSRRVGKD